MCNVFGLKLGFTTKNGDVFLSFFGKYIEDNTWARVDMEFPSSVQLDISRVSTANE